MTKIVVFNVAMSCGGCSGAVTKILQKVDGVKDIDANLETKKVTISCDDHVDESILNERLQKWSSSSGKKVELISALIEA